MTRPRRGTGRTLRRSSAALMLLGMASVGGCASDRSSPAGEQAAAAPQAAARPDEAPTATGAAGPGGAAALRDPVPIGERLGRLVIGNEVWRQCASSAGRTLPAGAEDHFWRNYQLVAHIIASEMEAGRFVPPRASAPMPPMSADQARMEVEAAAGRGVAASQDLVRQYGCQSEEIGRLLDLHEFHATRWNPKVASTPAGGPTS